MKNLIFILAFLPIISFSQEWIGVTKNQIITELREDGATFKIIEAEDIGKIITIIYSSYTMSLVLNNNSVCYLEMYTPLSNKDLNLLIKWFNENGISQGLRKWIIYYEGRILEAVLRDDLTPPSIFVFSYE